MSTNLQKNLAHNIIKNIRAKKPKNKKDLAVISGYSEKHAESHPEVIFEAKKIKKELKALGFNEEKAKEVVADILENELNEPGIRLKAASEIFKVMGTYAAEKTFSLTASANVDDLKQIIQGDMARFRQKQG